MRDSQGGTVWISLDKVLLDMARIEPPRWHEAFQKWVVLVCDVSGQGRLAQYSTPAAADMAFLKARQFILRGKTDEGKNLLIWPMEHMASEMDADALDAIARQTQRSDSVSISGDDPIDACWKLDGLP